MKIVKKYLIIVIVAIIILGCGAGIKSCHNYMTYSDTVEYELCEIDSGIYGYYNAVTSSIPAQNYEMIVLCFGDSIHTLKGNINIYYTDSECKVIWTKTNLVHGDTLDIYVPYGSIEMRPNLVQS